VCELRIVLHLSHRHLIAIASQVASCERPDVQVQACNYDDASRFALKNDGGTERGRGGGGWDEANRESKRERER
jgi:hypothetical protein